MKKLLTLYLLLLATTLINAQATDKKAHRKNVQNAESLFDKGAYQEAAKAFKKIIDESPHKLYSGQMLNAATAFAHINDETTTRDYLNQCVKIATNSDMEAIKKIEVFKKYHSKKWWKTLGAAMAQRLENLIQHHKNLVVFNQSKKISYSAIRINPNGDTLANTKIHMFPGGTGWGSPYASSQSEVVYIYESTPQDSIEHIQELRDIVVEKFWNCRDTTGIIENAEEVWMHPFRNNEFFKTEIAPFPVVHFPINQETMLKARSKIVIMSNWGTYSPTMTEQKYFYIGTENRDYNFEKNIECHKFEAYGHNSVHGISYLEYFFHPQHGFTEMNYLTYDNDRIEFQIIAIEKRN